MTLEHELGGTGARVPELDTAILGSGQYPVGIGSECNREHEVAVAFECLDALAALGAGVGAVARGAELPHLDRSVQAATDEILAVGREGDRVNGVLVAVGALKTLHQEAGVNVPHADALVQGTCRNVLGVGRDGHSRDTVLDRESEGVGTLLDIPQADSPVATAGGDRSSVTRKVQRVNILLVAREVVANRSALDIPDLDKWLAYAGYNVST